MRNFISLTSGTPRIDNSMSRNTEVFVLDRYPTHVRPELIKSIFRDRSDQFTIVVLTGDDPVIHCIELPEQIDQLITNHANS